MVFTQTEFFIFFGILISALLISKNGQIQNRILLVASLYFYGYWNWKFLFLVASYTIVNYYAGKKIYSVHSKYIKKIILIGSLVHNLGLLAVFKYYNLFIASLNPIIKHLGLSSPTLSIILPIGISFIAFEVISYMMDIYRGKIMPSNNFLDFALFVAFFPKLVSGPIIRASDLFPQISRGPQRSRESFYNGITMFIQGLFKKVFIADNLAGFIDYTFANGAVFNGLTLWLASLSYAIQIYCDFSGYSDMAIGISKVLGYEIKMNFNVPYISTSIQEFWRRWHISLSSWLRDYLYIPLGGNRKGTFRTYYNLLVTMLLGGLWHGASWTFVFWGGLHGGAIAINRAYHSLKERGNLKLVPKTNEYKRIGIIISWIATFVTVLIGWVFFRSPTFLQATLILKKMFLFDQGISWYFPFSFLAILLMVGYHLIKTIRFKLIERILVPNKVSALFFYIVLIWFVVVFKNENFQPFIYFQF
jgi:alginate O-acetyltransferase complex protein AlgI